MPTDFWMSWMSWVSCFPACAREALREVRNVSPCASDFWPYPWHPWHPNGFKPLQLLAFRWVSCWVSCLGAMAFSAPAIVGADGSDGTPPIDPDRIDPKRAHVPALPRRNNRCPLKRSHPSVSSATTTAITGTRRATSPPAQNDAVAPDALEE
jgi:hypothetical protein